MSKRRVLLSLGLILWVPLVGLLTFRLVVREPRIDRASFDRITFGMTAEEVGAVIGVRPGTYLDGRGYCVRYRDPDHIRVANLDDALRLANAPDSKTWIGEGGQITVRFDEKGLAVEKQFGVVCHIEEREPVLALLLRRVGVP